MNRPGDEQRKETPSTGGLPPVDSSGSERDSSERSTFEIGEAGQQVSQESTVQLPRLTLQLRTCNECGAVNLPEADKCQKCGSSMRPKRPPPFPSEEVGAAVLSKGTLRGRYKLNRLIGASHGVHSIEAAYSEDGETLPVVIRFCARPNEAPSDPPKGDGTAILKPNKPDTELKPIHPQTGVATLQLLKDLLSSGRSPVLPKLIDSFSEDGFSFLVESTAQGVPLLEAWKDPEASDAQRVDWLDQLRRMLMAIHDQNAIFPALCPSRLVVGKNKRLRITDLSGIMRLPVRDANQVPAGFYTAPEVYLRPQRADHRSDGYTLGAIAFALHAGRELTEADFEQIGRPRSLIHLDYDAPPTLLRLVGKTFVHDVDARFPLPSRKVGDHDGFIEIGEALAEHKRAVQCVGYDIAGWSSTGMNREKNEDCFTISNLSAGKDCSRRGMALACLSDGVGGYHGGEVASALAVSAVAEHLRQRGLSSAMMQQFGKDHPFSDIHRCVELLFEAVGLANEAIRNTAKTDPNVGRMACTVEAVLLVGQQAAIVHVGDSRVYHFRDSSLRQVTSDQTLVNQLVELGQITKEQAASHPRRSELMQAVGTHPEVHPDQYVIELRTRDWLLVCTDGLTAHVREEEIAHLLGTCHDAEVAARRLLNLTNSRGGTDNCTIIVARIK